MIDLSRRAILGGGLALAGCAAAPRPARAQSFFAAHDLPLGLQLYTLGDVARTDLDGTLAAVAAIGYRNIELANLLGRSAAEVRASLDRAGLACSSIHVQASGGDFSLSGDLAKVAADVRSLGCDYIVQPIFRSPERLGPRVQGERFRDFMERAGGQITVDDWKQAAAFLNEKGAILKREGLQLGYHNHNNEFAPLAGTTPLAVLLAETDPDLVVFELDAGWAYAAGQDVFALLKDHPGRFKLMHVKDIKPTTQINFVIEQDPTEVGSGLIPWPRLLPAAYEAGVRQFFVEQEPPFPGERIDSVRKSYQYLSTLVTAA